MDRTLPATMTAIGIPQPGGPEALVPEVRPVPQPGAGQVLVRVRAAGVNRPDVFQRQGSYPPPPGASDIPGLEVAGEVVAVGPGVTRWNIADRLTALVPGGGYAEYCVVDELLALPVPRGLEIIEAASLPENYFTVWTNVFERGGLAAGEWFLVHGGSSGIGTTAIQLAKAFGARVIATAGSDEKVAACLALGADAGINYRTQDFSAEAWTLTGKKGVDVILDMVAGDYAARNIDCAAMDGRIVMIATLGGPMGTVDLRKIMVRRLTLTGSTLRPRTVAQKAAIARQLEEKVWPLFASGALRPQIYATFPLREAAKAHALMESSAHVGKIMLTA
ncbi:MAG: NAD(P)H-quinone oxidoreductase [Proteobacteria bacterium]|nr:NAD(P)H-quinone oxidoreductase [Pseudomonadota bacterium]